MRPLLLCLVLLLAACGASRAGGAGVPELDLRDAVVLTPPELTGPERKAVQMLVEEVAERSQVRWPVVHAWPDPPRPAIVVTPSGRVRQLGGRFAEEVGAERNLPGREGYRLRVKGAGGPAAVFVLGTDSRGVLFGVGHLLRKLRMARGTVRLPANLDVTTAPRYPLRGHQLGYRPKTNSYDGWSLPMWEQYYRDLILFGANAVELIPPRSDDDADSPHFPLPPLEMMVGMSKLADDYGLDVWIWYPAMDEDYSRSETVELALKEWGEVFRRLPRIDAVFVPGGDPGHTQPKYLMALLEKQTANLRRSHPKAQMWVSPQSFSQAWLDEFLGILRARLIRETAQEEQALEYLRSAGTTGALAAMAEADQVLDLAVTQPPARELRARVFELAEALFQSIRMQLSVPRYQAIAVGRGANLDLIDQPLNDRPWLKRRFAEIRALAGEVERRKALDELVNWTNPGPGGFYDDLGNPARQPHLVRRETQPGFMESTLTGFASPQQERTSASDHAETLYETPLEMQYTGLDPKSRYQVRVVYGADQTRGKIRLETGGTNEIHPFIDKPANGTPVTWNLSPYAYQGGFLTLRWRREPGLGGNGRSVQVAEVWLIRKSPTPL